jgi:prophage maintenance system killer protein
MVWYPSVDDIIDTNKVALIKGNDRHPHRLRGTRQAIQSVIRRVIAAESRGLPYQTALLMKEILQLHVFDGGNHRTAYNTAELFLTRNGVSVKDVPAPLAYEHIKAVPEKALEEIEAWIVANML